MIKIAILVCLVTLNVAEALPQQNFQNSGFPGNSGMGGGYWTPSMEALLNPEYTQKLEAFSQQYANAVANLNVDLEYSKNLDAITRQYNADVAALNSYNWNKYGKRSADAEPQGDFPNPGFPGNSGMGGGYWTPSMEALLNPEYTQKLDSLSQQYSNAVASLKADLDYSKNLDAITRQYNNDVAALNSYNWHKYGKRSAEAEPQQNFQNSGYPGNSGTGAGYWTPSMEALLNPEYTQKLEAFSQQYANAVANLKVDLDYSKNLDAITRQYNADVAALNSYNWNKYGKRSAEADA